MDKPIIFVVYTKTSKSNAKKYLISLEGIHVDDILNENKRKPHLPYSYEIVHVGIGKGCEELIKKKYKIN